MAREFDGLYRFYGRNAFGMPVGWTVTCSRRAWTGRRPNWPGAPGSTASTDSAPSACLLCQASLTL